MDNGGLRYGAVEGALRPPLPTATQSALHDPTILLGLRRPKIRARLTDPSRRNIIAPIRGSERWVAGIKSESRPASDRNWWPASYSELMAGFVGIRTLLGFKFSPRIPDLKHRRLYSFEKPSAYPTLEPLIAGRIDIALIRAHWADILRIGASIRSGTVTASLIMRQLASHPRQNGVAAALRELGRLERTLFTLDWIEDPELRRGTGQELNKGESRNSLARAVFIHRLGEIRDRTYENQQHRASGLNLVVSAIILWNTRYLERAADVLRKFEDVPILCWPTCPRSAGNM